MKKLVVICLLLIAGVASAQESRIPPPIAPYSPFVRAGGTYYISGQIPIDPETRQLVKGNIQDQARQVMRNIGVILEQNGLSYANLVQCTIYLTDLDNYALVNEAYAEFFSGNYPARVCVQVSRLPMNAGIEISATAVAPPVKGKKQSSVN